MKNPLVAKFLSTGDMEVNGPEIRLTWELSELVREAMQSKKMKAEFHFDKEDGKLVFDKVLGKDENNDFYNEANGNLEERKEAIKVVIVTELLNRYNA